jgi:hypothetical protein
VKRKKNSSIGYGCTYSLDHYCIYEVDVFVERDVYKRGSNIIFISRSLFWEKKENRWGEERIQNTK